MLALVLGYGIVGDSHFLIVYKNYLLMKQHKMMVMAQVAGVDYGGYLVLQGWCDYQTFGAVSQ